MTFWECLYAIVAALFDWSLPSGPKWRRFRQRERRRREMALDVMVHYSTFENETGEDQDGW